MERRKREKRDKERIIGGLYLPSDDNDKFPSVITRSMLENVISRIDRIFSFNFFFFRSNDYRFDGKFDRVWILDNEK